MVVGRGDILHGGAGEKSDRSPRRCPKNQLLCSGCGGHSLGPVKLGWTSRGDFRLVVIGERKREERGALLVSKSMYLVHANGVIGGGGVEPAVLVRWWRHTGWKSSGGGWKRSRPLCPSKIDLGHVELCMLPDCCCRLDF